MELPAHDLTASASLPAQQQFYQEAGIEMAAFMGCESGEIQISMSITAASGSPSPMSLESILHQIFSEDFFQQSLLKELLQFPPTPPSSSRSSSLPSDSAVNSPAAEVVSTPLLLVHAAPPPVATTPSSSWSPLCPRPPLMASPSPSTFSHRHIHFPSCDADAAAMAEAMLAVISASSSSALPTTPPTALTEAPSGGGNNNHRGARRLLAAAAGDDDGVPGMVYKLAQEKPFAPKRYYSIDRVLRNEAVDGTHLAKFHQIEGLICDYGLTLGDLIGVLEDFFSSLGMSKLRFKPAYNPYTEPSMEIFSYQDGSLAHRFRKWKHKIILLCQ